MNNIKYIRQSYPYIMSLYMIIILIVVITPNTILIKTLTFIGIITMIILSILLDNYDLYYIR